MLERLSEKFAGKLISTGIISETDAEIYVYGFFQTVMLVLNVATTLFLGIIFQMIIPCILLNLAYIPIRISAGGHHADSPVKCYINSTFMIAALLAIIKWVPIHYAVSIVMLVVSSVVIWILAPVETENNPLDEVEVRVYRRRTKIVLAIELAVIFLCFITAKYQMAVTIILGLFTESIMLLIGSIKNH